MAYGIIRVRNLHQADLKQTEKHNSRNFGEKEKPANITGTYIVHAPNYEDINLEQAIEKRFQDAKVKQRTDSIVALEYVVTLSPDAMSEINRQNYSLDTILQHLSNFVTDKHGQENIISVSFHYDESNPHAHIITTPIIKKETKWKNQKGEGKKTENRLCARDFIGDKDKLRQLQTDYFNYISSDDVGLNLQKRFGIEFKRGVDARDRRARGEFYSKMTNYILGEVRKELEELKHKIKENKITIKEYEEKKQALETKISTVTSNIELKTNKDKEIYKKAEKWNENSQNLGM